MNYFDLKLVFLLPNFVDLSVSENLIELFARSSQLFYLFSESLRPMFLNNQILI